jgi:hypothetical protein
MEYRQLSRLSLALILASLLCGCGDSNPLGRKAISGSVSLDSVAVKQGRIDFQPMQLGGVPSGASITDGKYSIAAEKGLPKGKYRVTINAAEPGTGGAAPGAMPGDIAPVPKELIPEKFNTQSELTREVGDDKKSYVFDFDLKSK